MKTYDAIIIGFGKGGKTLAVELAKREWTVAVVERSEKMYGGTCINTGCIPTKTLIHQAKAAAMRLELPFDRKKEFYRRAVAVKEEVVSSLRDRNYHNLADRPGIAVYTGVGSFVSPDEVSVEGAEGRQVLKAKYIFIDTGAETVLPPIDGLSASRFLHTSASIMELKELPRRLAIVGGGYIGLEFASMYASFGSEVTVFEGGPVLMPREDRDVADSVRETLEKKGIVFRTGADVLSVRDSGGAAKVSWRQAGEGRVGELEADAVLIAAGRRPATEGLNLEAAGVKVDSRGAVIVDDRLRTSNPNIRAIGDVKGGLQFTYISLDDYRIIRDDLFGAAVRKTGDRNPVAYSVFIDPPLSHIGITEETARRNNLDVRVNRITVASIPRMRTIGETDGLLKAVIDARTNRILGCTLFCPESSEVINTVAVAMKSGRTAAFLRDFVFTHPSVSEALNDLFVVNPPDVSACLPVLSPITATFSDVRRPSAGDRFPFRTDRSSVPTFVRVCRSLRDVRIGVYRSIPSEKCLYITVRMCIFMTIDLILESHRAVCVSAARRFSGNVGSKRFAGILRRRIAVD